MIAKEVTCDCNIIHEDTVNKVKPLVLDNDTSEQLALFYKIFCFGLQ